MGSYVDYIVYKTFILEIKVSLKVLNKWVMLEFVFEFRCFAYISTEWQLNPTLYWVYKLELSVQSRVQVELNSN